jgi:mono/diheme cytochrome c family protein
MQRYALRVTSCAALLLLAAVVRGQQELLLEACVQCHDLRPIVTQKKSEAAWRRTVNEMIWRGAPLMPGEADAVVRYLSHEQRPREGRDVAATALPAGRGRELVLGACVQCHGLDLTVNARKSPGDWRRSVEQMARLGAKLTGSEIRIVAKYLASALGGTR